MQYLLEDRGVTVTIDGIFGPNTETAVEGFQADNCGKGGCSDWRYQHPC